MKLHEITCYKLTWPEVGEIMAKEIKAILGHTVSCEAKLVDTDYWGGYFDEPISLAELCLILQATNASHENWTDALPDEGNTVIYDIGWELGETLLRRNLGIWWEHHLIANDGLWLVNSRQLQREMLKIGGVELCFDDLKSKDELFRFFSEGVCNHAALMEFCEDYKQRYGNDLCWPYPIGEDRHLGLMLLLVKEGVLALPYDGVDEGTYEFFSLEGAHLMSFKDMILLEHCWDGFSADLKGAISDMASVLQKREVARI